MSSLGSTSGITFGGLASGLDTEGIIERIKALETSGISRLQNQQAVLRQRADLYASFKNQITNVATAANALNAINAFQSVSINVSDPAVVSATTTTGTQPGNYDFEVSKLAQAQKVSTNAQSSVSSALGHVGEFVVNGKTVKVEATDSLKSIAAKVNALNVGVSAGVIDGGNGQAFMTMSAQNTGLANKIQMSDSTGSVLSSLGVVSGATSIRQSITNGAASLGFSSSSTAFGTMIGASGLGPQTVQINGINVGLDLSTDSLQGMADKINLAATGATASVVAQQKNGTTTYRLEMVGSGSAPTFTDAANTLSTLGIVQQAAGHSLVTAQDAEYKIDSVALTSATNTIEDVIPGVKLTLLKANATTPEKSKLTLNNDSASVAEKVKGVMNSFNAALDFISANSAFDANTYATGPLFGDSLVQQFESTLKSVLLSNVPGLTGSYKNLVDIGFGFGSDGRMKVDDTKLTKAIETDPDAIKKLFQNFGTGSTPSLTYVSSTSSSLTSSTAPYDVNITQVATKTRYIAATTKTAVNTTSEKLTFAGNMFSAGSLDLTIDIGSSMADIVNKINNDPRLKELVVASDNSGTLQVDSKKYGSNGRFTLVSNQSPTADNSGVGFAAGTLTDGLDVTGTIAGQDATGVGQFLTGASTNTVANGLQIEYSGSSTGLVGTMSFARGLVGLLNSSMTSFTDFSNGMTVTGEKSLRDQADSIQKDIERINKRADEKAAEMRNRFSIMEQRIGQLQQQGTRLASLMGSSTAK
ncbi:MAG TPA: flagellar filament capping protein FliD [Fimbriimonas sp.]|nr:flagellar filament capping protein FliD [Fimbriimonas sp.]